MKSGAALVDCWLGKRTDESSVSAVKISGVILVLNNSKLSHITLFLDFSMKYVWQKKNY